MSYLCFFRDDSYYRIRVLGEPISFFLRSLDCPCVEPGFRLYCDGRLVARSAGSFVCRFM